MKTIARIFIHNWPLKLLSVVLGVVSWLYVLLTTNPWTVREIEVPVAAERVPGGLQVMSVTPATIRVSVAGRRRSVDRVGPGSLRALARLKAPAVGESEAPVTVSLISRLHGVRIDVIAQNTVLVALDRTVQQPKAVQVSIRGRPAPGFQAVGQACRPNQVTLSGPQMVIREVARVVAVVDISGIDSSRTLVSRIEARDARDMPIASVRVDPPNAEVGITIARVNTKTVPVVLGELELPAGVALDTVDVAPQIITVTGDPAVLARLRFVRTAPARFGPGETVIRVGVVLPRGATAVTDDSIRISIEVAHPRAPERHEVRPPSREGPARGTTDTGATPETSPPTKNPPAPTEPPSGTQPTEPETGGDGPGEPPSSP